MAARARQGRHPLEERASEIGVRVCGGLTEARLARGWSEDRLAEAMRVETETIVALDAGSGSVATMLAAMDALDFQIAGIGRGDTLGEQIANRLDAGKPSRDKAAARTGLDEATIERLTQEDGTLDDLFRLLAVVAPGVRRRAPERAYWGRGDKVDRDSRFTPAEFMTMVYDAFGPVDTDPCAHPASPVVAARRIILAEGGDGLTDQWSGRLAFVNPPYSRQIDWLSRAYQQWSAGHVQTVLCLVPVRTDNRFFHETLRHVADLFLLKGRLNFANVRGEVQPTPFSLCVVALGATAEQKARFAELAKGCWFRASDVAPAGGRIGRRFNGRRHTRRFGLKAARRLRLWHRHDGPDRRLPSDVPG